MKITNKTFVLIFVVSILLLLLVFQSCSNKSGSPDESVFMGKLTKTWNVSVVLLDNQDVTSLFPNLQLSFTTDKTYAAANPVAPIWKANGSFTVSGTSPHFHLIRDEGIDVSVVELDTKLILEFQYDKKLASGKVNGVSGMYHFEFK